MTERNMDASLDPVGVRKFTNRSKRQDLYDKDLQLFSFPTNFSLVLKNDPPKPLPSAAPTPKKLSQSVTTGVKAMVKVFPIAGEPTAASLTCDVANNEIIVQQSVNVQKSFSFDAVFPQDASLAEICSTSLDEVLQAVVQGSNGCIFCYGHAGLGKTYTMLGIDDSSANLGVIPCAISWIYNLMNEKVEKSDSKFSVRVSAIEVTGKQGIVRDLLAEFSTGHESVQKPSSEIYFHEDPIGDIRIENQTELRAPTAAHAAHYLDAAIASSTVPDSNSDDLMISHFRFSLHIYQYRIGQVSHEVCGGRSQLHFLDLGKCYEKEDGDCHGNSVSIMGMSLMSAIGGQQHLLRKDNSLTQLICESMGNEPCHTCMIALVSPSIHLLPDTLQVLKLASRIRQLHPKKKPNMLSGTSSDDSERYSEPDRITEGRSSTDPEYISSSEQSCDTVIFVGKCRQLIEKNCKTRTRLNRSRCSKISEEKEVRQHRRYPLCKSQSNLDAANSKFLNNDSGNSTDILISHISDNQPSFQDKTKRQVDGIVTCLLESYQRVNCIRHDPLGNECCQNFDEISINSTNAVCLTADEATSNQRPLESVHCRVKKGTLHQFFPNKLMKQNELWVDGPIVNADQSKNGNSLIMSTKDNPTPEVKPIKDHGMMQLLSHSKGEKIVDRRLEQPSKTMALQCVSTRKMKAGEMNSSNLTLIKDTDVETHYKEIDSTPIYSRTRHCKTTANSNRLKSSFTIGLLPEKNFQKSVGCTSGDEPTRSTSLSTIEFRPCIQEMQTECVAAVDKFVPEISQDCMTPAGKDQFRRRPTKFAAENDFSNANRPTSRVHSSDIIFHSGIKEKNADKLPSDIEFCDRTANWVKNVPDVSSSRFVQQLHSRKELLRSLRIQKHGLGSKKLPTADFFHSCRVLATFDQPIVTDHRDDNDKKGSPPPAYELLTPATNSLLDINENEAGISKYADKSSRTHKQLLAGAELDVGLNISKTTTCRQRPADSQQIFQNKQLEKKGLVDCFRGTLLLCGKSTAVHDPDDYVSQTPFVDSSAPSNNLAENKRNIAAHCCIPPALDILGQSDGASNPNLTCQLKDSEEGVHVAETQVSFSYQHRVSVDVNIDKAMIGQMFSPNPTRMNFHGHFSDFVSGIPTSTTNSEIHLITSSSCSNIRQCSELVNCLKSKSIVSCLPSDSNLARFESSFFKISQIYQRLYVCSCSKVEKFSAFKASSLSSLCCKHKLDENLSLLCDSKALAVKSTSTLSTLQSGDLTNLKKQKTTSVRLPGRLHQSHSVEDLVSLKDHYPVQDQKCDFIHSVTSNRCRLMICPENNSSSLRFACNCCSGHQPGNSELREEECNETKKDDIINGQTWIHKNCQLKKWTSRSITEQIEYLLHCQDQLKKELETAKDMLMVDRNLWSFDLHVADQLDSNDPSYLEALQHETVVLNKRVKACKSRIMMITVFDIST